MTSAGAGEPPRAVDLFYAYSHKDERLRDKLETHLSILKRNQVISSWHDRRIPVGVGWTGAIDEHLNGAAIILLLVSADFIASDYCYDKEMRRAMERHELGEARVIPVILRPCDWQGAPFGKLQGLPKDMKPVTSWASRDEALKCVATGIREAAAELREGGPRASRHAVKEGDDRTQEESQTDPASAGAPHRTAWRPDKTTLLTQGPHIEVVISRAEPESRQTRTDERRGLAIRALIDTGASVTIINPQIAETCKLVQTDWVNITTVGGVTGQFPGYAASLSFPGRDLPALEIVRVVACPIIEQRFFSCLIGRDILRRWRLVYDGLNGEVEVRA
jgi:predicted aspartyl protease